MAAELGLADLWCLRARIACCTALVMLALGSALAAHLRLAEARAARLRAEQELLAQQQRLIRTEAEHAEYLARLQRYRDIARRQMPLAEPRLEWLAQLRSATARRHVSALEYEFAAQVDTGAAPRPSPELRASRMSLRITLLHEEDLLGLLADLRAKPGTLLGVRACSIERIPPGEPMAAALRAACSIDWMSLREAT